MIATTQVFCFSFRSFFSKKSYDDASTKYPLVLAHGMAFTAENLGIIDYWWDIDNELQKHGVKVYKTAVNAMDGTRAKAKAFKAQVMDILAETGAAKINVLGHSHGAIYVRDAISNLGLAPYVASYTSVGGPHQGSTLADLMVVNIPDGMKKGLTDAVNLLYKWILKDNDPDSLQNALDITTFYMKDVFNPNTPDMPGIYYQSYAAKAKWGCPNFILTPLWLVMLTYEGPNDSMVSVKSAQWGDFHGTMKSAWYSPGVDHFNSADQMFGITPGIDIPGFYVNIAQGLKKRGF